MAYYGSKGSSVSSVVPTRTTLSARRRLRNGGNYSTNNRRLRVSPLLVDRIFGTTGYYGDECGSEEFNLNEEHLVEDEIQLELPLQSTDELMGHLQRCVNMYEDALDAMGEHALKWHFLMEDIESNSQLRRMFDEIQMVRQLTGGQVNAHKRSE